MLLDDEPLQISPAEFEAAVEALIRRAGVGLSEFEVRRLETIDAQDGTYEIDVTARFEALGARLLVLIECKRHRSPIKRETVQVLLSKLLSIGAQKGIIVSTTRFQRGAVEFAAAHGIALLQFAHGGTSWVTQSADRPTDLPPWVPKTVFWWVTLRENGNQGYTRLRDDTISEFKAQMCSLTASRRATN